MYNQGDAVGSTWILNFQPMRRRYVTRRRQTTSVGLDYAHGPWRNRFWVLVQARPLPGAVHRPCVGRWKLPEISVVRINKSRNEVCEVRSRQERLYVLNPAALPLRGCALEMCYDVDCYSSYDSKLYVYNTVRKLNL